MQLSFENTVKFNTSWSAIIVRCVVRNDNDAEVGTLVV